jgi:hypothetical protein
MGNGKGRRFLINHRYFRDKNVTVPFEVAIIGDDAHS